LRPNSATTEPTGPRRGAALGPAALAAALGLVHVALYWGTGPIDDDYIVQRYAANLLAGHGFVFNPGGEAAEGFTSPLWLAVALVLHTSGAAGDGAVKVLGGLALALAAAVGAQLGAARATGRQRWLAAWPGYATAASPALAYHAVAGLGTLPLAAALLAFGAAWVRAERLGRPPWAAGWWLAVAALLRQEAALLWLPFCAAGLRRRQLGPLAPALLALLGWTAARFVWFGRLDPVTHAVKRLPLAAELEYGLLYFADATRDAALGWLALAALIVLLRRSAGAAWRGLAAGFWLHTLYVVAVGGDWMPLARFAAPVLPLGFSLAGEAIGARRRWPLALAAFVGLLAPQAGQLQRAQVLFDRQFFEARWLALGAHFREAAPGARVALSPIGAFGYASRLTIVDLLGLTHTGLLHVAPDLDRVRLKGHHRHDKELVLCDPPEHVLLGNAVLQPDTGRLAVNPWEQDLVLDPRFRERYVQVRAVIDGAAAEWFRRRDVAPLAGEVPR